MMAPMKIARSSFACCRVKNLVYIISGTTKNYHATKSVEIYDTNIWCDGVELPVAKYDLHACVVNNEYE